MPRLGPRTEERVTLPACRGTSIGKHLGRAVGEDQSADGWEWASRPATRPVRAKDLLDGIGSEILRGLLLCEDHEEIRWSHGCSIDEARVSLACSDLATLRMWDLEALVQAATICSSEEQRVSWGHETREAMNRRVALAMCVPGTPPLMSPADGVLFLRGAGIHVYFELVDAVAVMTIREEGGISKYRELKRLSPGALSDPAIASEEGAPNPLTHSASPQQLPSQESASFKNWRNLVKPYVLHVLGSRPTLTGKELFRALEAAANDDPDCPFEIGVGSDRGKLVVRQIPQAVSSKTIENWMKELKLALRKT